jgi:hypothetical protein
VDGDTCTNNLNIYIDDSRIPWKEGQTFKLKIKNYIDFDGKLLYIHTGLENNEWNQNIVISGDDISETPTIELVCVDTVMKQTKSSFIYECSASAFGTIGSSGSTGPSDDSAITEEQLESLIQETLDN